jgi:NDP-sugar pyrophosphorylase family protein
MSKAMILAAGLGTRMRPLTDLRAKPVLPVLNRPLLHWTLELLARHGVTEVFVNLHHLPATVKKALRDGSDFGLVVHTSNEPEILGTGGGPRKIRQKLGDEPFLLLNGDILCDFDLSLLRQKHRASGARATLALRPNPDPRVYGPIVTGPRGEVRSLVGLPKPAPGKVSMFTGVHVMDPAILDRLRPGPSDSVRELYAPLVAEGELVLGVRMPGFWYDLGDPALYVSAQVDLLKSGRLVPRQRALVHETATVHPSAEIAWSIVGPGCVVGQDAVVDRSVLWERASIGPRATVVQSVVATSARVPARATLKGAVFMPGSTGTPTARVKRTAGRS